MKNKDLKNFIKHQADQTPVPDKKAQILQQVNHKPSEQVVYKPVEPTKYTAKPVVKRKKLVWAISAVCAVLLVMMIPLSILFFNQDPDGPGGPNGPGGNDGPLLITKAEEVLSREMFALGNVISFGDDGTATVADFGNKQMPSLMSANAPILDIRSISPLTTMSGNLQSIYDNVAHEVHYYLLTGEAFIAKNNIVTTYQNNDDAGFSSYKYKMTVSYTDKSQTQVAYVAYFNQTTNGNITNITGVFVVENVQYDMQGSQTKRNDEVESTLVIDTKDNGYIKITNETETNENEYEYEYYQNGRLIRGVSLEVSTEGGRQETEIEITQNNVTKSYEFEYKSNNVINCEFEVESGNGETEQEMTITVYSTYYLYQFQNNVSVKINRE